VLTVADRAAGVMLVLATGFVTWACARQGEAAAAVFASAVGGLLFVIQAVSWARSRRSPADRIEALADGSLWLHTLKPAPCRMAAGPGTRLIGPSVFLDLYATTPGAAPLLRCWITPLDAPRDSLRRLGVVLAGSGRVAGS
jgi:hypothetical protein